MRRLFLLSILCSFFAASTLAQENNVPKPQNQPQQTPPPPPEPPKPYLDDVTIPSFDILEMDSATVFNTGKIPKGKKSAIIFFDPHCGHCINFTHKLLAGMDSLKDIQFYMITSVHEMSVLRAFYDEYHLKDYKNIKMVGRDLNFFFLAHYGVMHFPGLVIYDEHKKFVNLFQGEISIDDIYKSVH